MTSVVDPVSVEGNDSSKGNDIIISVYIVQCDIIVSCVVSPQETVTIEGSSTGTYSHLMLRCATICLIPC